MAGADTIVRARSDRIAKREATLSFRQTGITVPDAIRLMPVRAWAERALPFEARAPNPEMVTVLHDSWDGVVTHFTSVDDPFAGPDD